MFSSFFVGETLIFLKDLYISRNGWVKHFQVQGSQLLVFARIRIIIINRVFTVSNTTRNQVKISPHAYLRRFIIPRWVIDVIG